MYGTLELFRICGCCDQDKQRGDCIDAVRNSRDSHARREAVFSFFHVLDFFVLFCFYKKHTWGVRIFKKVTLHVLCIRYGIKCDNYILRNNNWINKYKTDFSVSCVTKERSSYSSQHRQHYFLLYFLLHWHFLTTAKTSRSAQIVFLLTF
jgi:hypothetical protein